jgi:UDP-GlcNAc3NAcA epimerase
VGKEADMKLVTVIGARPQFVKAAVLSRLFRERSGIQEILVHTGQHYDENMSDVFFKELEIPRPDYHLGIGSGPHGQQTGRMLEAIEKVLQEAKPDLVLVYGDTNSTLAGALGAVKLHVPVAHVEAGLRSFNRKMPEEINRVVTDHLSRWLFAPTTAAVANLRREGVANGNIFLVGDVMYDATLHSASRAGNGILDKHCLKPKGYILATIHRAENTDNPERLGNIVSAFQTIAATVPVVLPLHPRTRAILQRGTVAADLRPALLTPADRKPTATGLHLLEPVGYLDMIELEKNARLIATDSGGVQKEAYFHRVPCITLRDETEWVELVELGWNQVVPPDRRERVVHAVRQRLDAAHLPAADADLYGGGQAGKRILDVLASH